MQVKKDLIDGELNCGENTAALLTAFILQGKLIGSISLYTISLTYFPKLLLVGIVAQLAHQAFP